MKLHETLFGRLLAQVMVYALVQASIPPAWAVSLEAPRSLPESPRQQAKPTAFESYAAELSSVNPDWAKLQRLAQSFPVIEKPAASRVLGASEMESRKGLLAVNPYVAGSQKWSVNYAGIDLLTGNYSTSATDLSFEGGYGIPINVTRTYSSNNPDDGPLGRGWTLSVDIRTTAGGILKGKGSPDRSVPVEMFDRPQAEYTRGASTLTFPYEILTEGVIAKDAGGFEEDIMRDVDGILTTPPWDSNVYEGALEKVNGEDYWLNNTLYMTTPEGTLYKYAKYGSYQDGGAKSAFDESEYPERTPSNILKIDRITDRHGNETVFDYTGTATYYRATGEVVEAKLDTITMPGGRTLHFTFNGYGRLSRIADGTGSDARCVDYTYDDNLLDQVETGITIGSQDDPLVTTYGYGNAGEPEEWAFETAGDLLTSITDPRGMETEIYYWMGPTRMIPYTSWGVPAPQCYAVKSPKGVYSIAGAYEASSAVLLGESLPTGHGTAHDKITFGQYYRVEAEPDYWVELSQGQVFVEIPDGDINDPFLIRMQDMRAIDAGEAVNPKVWERTYNINLGHLTSETSYIHPYPDAEIALETERKFNHGNFAVQKAHSTMTYNFLGAPLKKETDFYTDDGVGEPAFDLVSSSEVQYAYHGPEKYFQQKAMRAKVDDTEWRYSYTDYYENDEYTSGAARGMTKFVYDPKYGGIVCSDEDEADWRTNIVPTANQHSAKFEYDSEGRIVEVQKLHNTTSTWVYVTTTTSYLGSGDGAWGLPGEVVEDDGGLDRTTTTDEYDRAGRATVVTDGAGRTFETTYNARGQVELVKRTDPTPDVDIVQYVYGMDDGLATNGMVTDVYDLLSGAWTSISYFASDNEYPELRGQVDTVYNDDGLLWSDYYVYYGYDAAGRRANVSYEFPYNTTNNITNYGYRDYISVGSPESPSYVFQTMTLLDGAFVRTEPEDEYRTPEEFHYRFDTAGRMLETAFAQTPQGSAPFYPTTGGLGAGTADVRALAVYDYRPAGELEEVRYHWQVLGDPNYVTTNIGKVNYAYADYIGLRESATFTPGDGGGWDTPRTEYYTYDEDLDYLTGVDYNDSIANEVQTWTYDAAGNRSNTGYAYDHLNRMTASPGSTTYDYDDDPIGLLGFRLWRNPESSTTTRYSWDDAGRMTQVASNTGGANYMYRADGMRIKKVTGLSIAWQPPEGEVGGFYNEEQADDNPTWRYRYDGQMCFEEDFTRGDPVEVTGTSYALGARGIDMMRTFTVYPYSSYTRSYTGTEFPIYDGHGNMIATLVRDGGGWELTNERGYDVWGRVRTENDDEDPNNRYCANLGHKQDDESDLIYMRARYYEPGTGRFISEDPAMDGRNWFQYCLNDPVNRLDVDGKLSEDDKFVKLLVSSGLALVSIGWLIYSALFSANVANKVLAYSGLVFITSWFAIERFTNDERPLRARLLAGFGFIYGTVGIMGGVLAFALQEAAGGLAGKPIDIMRTYSLILTLFLALMVLETQ